MKILIDKNIPYTEHFFQDHLNDIEYFTDQDFDISKVAMDSIVITRSTFKTHGKKISNAVKFLCSASTGEDHYDKKALDDMNIPYAFSTGANAVAVAEYTFSTLALMLKEYKFEKKLHAAAIIGCGNIGSQVIKTLDAFDFEVYGYDPLNVECKDSNTLTHYSDFVEYSGSGVGDDIGLYEALAGIDKNSQPRENISPIRFISLHVPLHDGIDIENGASLGGKPLSEKQILRFFIQPKLNEIGNLEFSKQFPTKNLINKEILEQLPDGAIILNTSRGGVVSERDFLELDSDRHYIRLISDVFENEPNVNKDFLEKNLFGTPHIAGHSQYARYQMTKMAYENVVNFLGVENIDKENILENKIIDFDKRIFDQDMKEFGLPVSLMLDTYNPKLDHFKNINFKNIRDKYNNRIGYSQVIIKGCNNDADRIALKMLGFTVEDS